MRLTTLASARGGANGGLVVRPALAVTAIIGSLGVIFELDRTTGSAPVQHLYYVPIVVAGARFGRTGGWLAALAAVVLYHSANPQLLTFSYQQWDLLQMAVFLAVGLITAKIMDDRRRLQSLAMTDDLTGLHNLRSFERELTDAIGSATQSRTTLALLVIDLDRLKSINDAHGHLAGAEAVRTVGHLIAGWIPPGAAACRYGGDEFVVAIPDCTATGASALADRLRETINRTAPTLAGTAFPAGTLSVSVGVACQAFGADGYAMRDDPGETLFRRADAALYQAKLQGRNHVRVD